MGRNKERVQKKESTRKTKAKHCRLAVIVDESDTSLCSITKVSDVGIGTERYLIEDLLYQRPRSLADVVNLASHLSL